jgi:hypothetical protein
MVRLQRGERVIGEGTETSKPMKVDPLIDNYRQTLLGKLKLKLFARIVAKLERVPSHRRVLRYILDQWRKAPMWGELATNVLLCRSPYRYELRDLPHMGPNLKASSLDFLPRQALFSEVRGEFSDTIKEMGLLILGRTALDGTECFMVCLLTESAFPDAVVGLYHVFLGTEAIRVSRFGRKKHRDLSERAVLQDQMATLVLRVLLNIANEHRPKMVKTSELDGVPEVARPPTDRRLMRLLKEALRGKVPIIRGMTHISLVHPHSLDHCLSIPTPIIEGEVKRISNRKAPPAMLVYWSGTDFVMSDDYVLYLAHRKLRNTRVPVVVIGACPAEHVEVQAVGGPELLPPVTIVRTPDSSKLSDGMKQQMLDEKLELKRRGYKSAELIGIFMRLADLLHADPDEAQLHRFLKQHALAIDAYGTSLRSELWLRKQYRVDLVLRTSESTRRLVLIELERAGARLLTRAHRPTAKLTHATQQVEDWLRWWDENPQLIPSPFEGSVRPDGWVIMGRSLSLNQEDRRRLASLNANRRVKVLTYDDLLDQLQALIEGLDGYDSGEE